MCSYNRLNNSYACANSKTLNGLLKTELGFKVRISSLLKKKHDDLLTCSFFSFHPENRAS